MALAPISSVGSYNKVQPLNYRLSNESVVSAAYMEAVKRSGGPGDKVLPVDPVAYPDSKKVPLKSSDKLRTDAMFNAVAGTFDGEVTGYERNGSSSSYSTAGAHIDYLV